MSDSLSGGSGHHCDTCGKTFSTNSHLRRHEALHSGRTTVVCPSCDKKFSRLDTARRHVKVCSPGSADTMSADSRRGKAPQACDTCAQRKLSCNATEPCSRCVSSKTRCTYERRDAASPTTSSNSLAGSPSSRAVISPANVSETKSAAGGKIPIEFLLAFTAPAEHGATTTLITTAREQSSRRNREPSLGPSSTFEFNFEAYDTLFWDQQNWTPEFFEYMNNHLPIFEDQRGTPSTLFRAQSVIEGRMVQLCQHLADTQANVLANNPYCHIEFDTLLAEELFTATNLENFTQAYFRQIHQYYPFVHQPTFHCETSPLPLLLAIFLFGSLSCAPTDSTLSARKFFDVAEEYVFNHSTIQELHNGHTKCVWSEEKIEVLQAALVIEIVQNGTNNVGTRRRLRTKRHPSYISGLKSIGLFHSAREATIDICNADQSNWQSFIEKEKRTRLAMWAFTMDSCFSIMFNSCPLLSTSDLDFHYPCPDAIWEAETEGEYEQLIIAKKADSSHPKPSQLIRDLLQDTWIDDPHKNLTAAQVSVAICALQSLSMTAKYSFALPTMENTILRATDRWQDLWHIVFEDSNSCVSGTACPQTGFLKHTEELCWFVRKLVHAGRNTDPDCRYAQIMPTDDIKVVHDFLCK